MSKFVEVDVKELKKRAALSQISEDNDDDNEDDKADEEGDETDGEPVYEDNVRKMVRDLLIICCSFYDFFCSYVYCILLILPDVTIFGLFFLLLLLALQLVLLL